MYFRSETIYGTSLDYNKNAATTKAFFAKVQNKLHYGVHGYTAAKLIHKGFIIFYE